MRATSLGKQLLHSRRCKGYTLRISRSAEVSRFLRARTRICLAPRLLHALHRRGQMPATAVHIRKEVAMIRALAILVAVLLAASVGVAATSAQMKTDPQAQPKAMDQKPGTMDQKTDQK